MPTENREICFFVLLDSSKKEPEDVVSFHLTKSDAAWTVLHIISPERRKQMVVREVRGRMSGQDAA
jgi:hypothetical protein